MSNAEKQLETPENALNSDKNPVSCRKTKKNTFFVGKTLCFFHFSPTPVAIHGIEIPAYVPVVLPPVDIHGGKIYPRGYAHSR